MREPRSLAYLLLRVNDWVEQVEAAANKGVWRRLRPEHVRDWLPLLGMLAKLRDRSRMDHSWLIGGVEELFRLPECRDALREAVRSADRGAARMGFAIAMGAEVSDRCEFVELALQSFDPVVRMSAASCVKEWTMCPNRATLLTRMGHDPFMPIRRQALYAMLDSPKPDRTKWLVRSLLDFHHSMRHAARVYLREEDTGFDARAVYFDTLSGAEGRSLASAIAGLGETGAKSDAEMLLAFAGHRRACVAAAAVRAIVALDGDQRVEWLIQTLSEASPAAAREAAVALEPHVGGLPVERLKTLVTSEFPHTRRLALRLLLRRHPFDAITDALRGAMSEDTALAGMALEYIDGLKRREVRNGPTQGQSESVRVLLESERCGLEDRLDARVREFIRLPRRVKSS